MNFATTFSGTRQSGRGFTLTEVLVVIVIVALLGAIGFPSYMAYVTRANRSAAKSLLLQIADRQEQFFADNKQYAGNMTQLGYATNGFAIDKHGAEVPAASTERLYAVALTNTSATTFTVNAAPELGQATRDGKCATLTLTHAGQKGQTGTSTECW